MGSRGAQGARAGPAADTRHQVPRAGSAPVAMLAVGQAGTHATTSFRIAYVTGSHAWVAHYGIKIEIRSFQDPFLSFLEVFLKRGNVY